MADRDRFRQCLLRRGSIEETAWIPTHLANEGAYVRLGDSNGWLVVNASTNEVSRELLDIQRDARLQRRSTIDG